MYNSPLNDTEAAMLYITTLNGVDSWPIRKIGSGWHIGPWREWKGFPVVYKTRKAARAQFQAWMDLANERYKEMKMQNPDIMLTAVGIKEIA